MNTLVLDQGGHSSRALVFNPQGKCIAKAQHQLSASIACQQHHIEIDPLKVLLSLQHCIDDILKNHNIFIEQAALICQRSNLLACSRRTLQPITDIISWQDTRNSTALDLSIKNNTLNPERFQCITGLRPNAHLGFSKIQYLLAHNVAIKKHLSDNDLIFMPASAWLAAKLCSPNQSPAEVLCDPSCAQRMGLVDIHSGEWSNELLTLFSIPRHCLPTITDTLHHWGTLPAGIALKLLGGDQSFIPFIASKKMRDESLFINIGSGAFILCESILPKTHSGNGLYSVYKQHKNKHLDPSVLSETIINSAATSINQYHKKYQSQGLPADLSTAISVALAIENTSDIPLYINAGYGLASPYWHSRVCEYFSYSSAESNNPLYEFKAIIESLLFLININIDVLQAQQGTEKQRIILSGGLSKSNALAQSLADISGLEVWQNTEAETSAVGAACYLLNAQYPLNIGAVYTPAFNAAAINMKTRYQPFKTMMKTYVL